MEKAPDEAALNGVSTTESTQQAVIAFLSDPKTHACEGEEGNPIETHAAMVFLAGDRAYKMKRAVKLPYLDFSTLEKRRNAIERELEINSRISPELYIAAMPVTRAADSEQFQLGGTGETVDWVLIMRRFDQDALLNSIASDGKLDRRLAMDLAQTVEHFHRLAARHNDADFRNSLERIAGDLETVLCGPEARVLGLKAEPFLHRLRDELSKRKNLIEEREREGFVRQCHGDLHLKNIVLWEGKPKLFDAIEFDDRLATIDVLYDLAFLLMDLEHRGLRSEANIILNHYFQRAAICEIGGLALLPLFMATRAGIRSMTGIHSLGTVGPAIEMLAAEIAGYTALAESILKPSRPKLIAIGGVSGTGKTSVACEVAPLAGDAPGALHLRTDVERKVMQGVALDQPLPRDAYTFEMRDEVYRRVFKKAEVALNAGRSVVVDAVFPEDSKRNLLCELAQGTNAGFWGFWLEADASTIWHRIAARGPDASDANAGVAAMQLETVEKPQDWIKVDASQPLDAIAASIAKKLRQENR